MILGKKETQKASYVDKIDLSGFVSPGILRLRWMLVRHAVACISRAGRLPDRY